MTRGRRGPLTLQRMTFSFTTPCRFIPAHKELVYGLAQSCNIPLEKSMATVTDYGNTAAASIPLALNCAYEQGRVKRGSKILMVGGAAGFSVGVIPIIW